MTAHIIRLTDHCPISAQIEEARASEWLSRPRLSVPVNEATRKVCRESEPTVMLTFTVCAAAFQVGILLGAIVVGMWV